MTINNQLIIFGAGGHAKVVLSTALANHVEIVGLIDDNQALHHTTLWGYPIFGSMRSLETKQAILAFGSNQLRQQLATTHRNLLWQTIIHPTAIVHPSVTIGEGSVVFAGSIIQPDSKIGKHCIINTGVTVDHDCVIGDYTHLAPGVHLAGGVQIGEGGFLGIGSVVLPQIRIGEWVIVAAGSVVTKSIAAKAKVMGVPAREKITV